MKRTALTLAAALLFATNANAAEFLDSTYTTYIKLKPYSGEVNVLNSAPAIGKYTEIGVVRVTPKEARNDYETALMSLKKAAAQHGATAIVLQPDAQLFSQGKTTDRGTTPEHISAMAVTLNN